MAKNNAIVLLVDDELDVLKRGKEALANRCNVFTAISAKKMFEFVENEYPDLILLDINMPDMNGFESLKTLKSNPKTKDIPVILLPSHYDIAEVAKGLELGAIDYIIKPFLVPLLIERVKAHLLVVEQQKAMEFQRREFQNFNDVLQEMVEEKTSTIKNLQRAILQVMAEMVESRDDVTGGHIDRTQRGIGILIGNLMEQRLYSGETENWDVETLQDASQLHDVGKIYIDDQILRKPGKLTAEEFEFMQKHTDYGNTIIDRIEAITRPNKLTMHAKIFAGFHHEKWDGSGYPLGLSGLDIPLQGRIMAVADVYDALVSERPYKKGMPHEEAVRIILEGKGSHFDPVIVDVFVMVAEEFRV
ncbi:HD domain-containing phosphohydrolase [Breznakiellaceae bacterium SP9]